MSEIFKILNDEFIKINATIDKYDTNSIAYTNNLGNVFLAKHVVSEIYFSRTVWEKINTQIILLDLVSY